MRRMQHPVPPDILREIGDITVSFAMLESQIQSLTGWLFPSNDRIPKIVSSLMSFKNALSLLEGVYLERLGKGSQYDRLVTLLIRARKIEEIRNQITHSVWGAADAGKSVTRIKATCKERKGLQYKFEHMTTEEFQKIAAEIKILAGDFLDFMLMLTDEGLIGQRR